MNLEEFFMREDVSEIEYKRKLLDNTEWTKKADALLETASLMEPKITEFWESWNLHKKDRTLPVKSDRFIGIYFMLVSFAIENLFKSLIVKGGGENIQKEILNNRWPKELKTHDLVVLAKKVRFPIESRSDEHLIRRLMRHAVWAGRYPVPLSSDNLLTEKHDDGVKYLSILYWENDIRKVKTMIEKIRQFAEIELCD